jgi:MATE family multidrug resistance protein
VPSQLLVQLHFQLKKILALAAPLILGQLAHVLMLTIDTLFAGHLGEAALAAVSAGGNFNVLPHVMVMGLLMGIPALVSAERGANRAGAGVGAFVRQTLKLALILGLIWAGAAQVLAEPLAHKLGLPPATAQLAADFWRVYALSGVGFSLMLALRYSADGMGITLPSLWAGLLGLACNAALNAWWVPGYGVLGSAWASVVASWVMAATLFLAYLKHPVLQTVDLLGRVTMPAFAPLSKVVTLGAPIALSLAAEAGLFVWCSARMAQFGESTLAAYAIALNIITLIFMVPLGIAQAITPSVGFYVGAKQPAQSRFVGWLGVALGGGNALINVVLMLTVGHVAASFYTDNPALAAAAAHFLAMACWFQVVDGIQVTAAGALRGLQDTTWPVLITLVAYWLIGAPAAYVLSERFGADGLWWGLALGLGTAALLLCGRFYLKTR